ncbi:hypothetical protein DY000_02020478 [Brassica cretica]|uniref:Uncharacterized protein n=1 Tax=Brassica cretica TaxID=69181 RepID=A0ABQ7E9R5_BRACR|nr:hypothetical protein DY000_02020478 [Brassica cretica]
MRGDTRACTCPVACLLYMPGDTAKSTWLSGSCVVTHGPLDVSSHALFADTATPRASTCQAAGNTPSCGDTSCFVDR